MSDITLINGPINATRLEGTMFGIKKVIYLFYDYHGSVKYQTQCPSFLSDDFVRYFAKTIKNVKSKVTYDLFFEIGPKFETNENSKYRGRYIDEVFRFFKDTIKITNTKGKKIIDSTQNNLRLHYINIRDYLKSNFNHNLDIFQGIIKKSLCEIYLSVDMLTELHDLLDKMENDVQSLLNLLKSDGDNITKGETISIDDIIKYYVQKMLTKYKHGELKNILVGPVINVIKNTFSKMLTSLSDMHIAINDYKKEYKSAGLLTKSNYDDFMYGTDSKIVMTHLNKLYMLMCDIEYYSLNAYSYIIDLFFLRRFLDKDYITNGIVYTGAAHSIMYIYILVKYFNFSITNSSYMDKNLDIVMKKIKETDDVKKIYKHLLPEKLSQCVDLTGFPSEFT